MHMYSNAYIYIHTYRAPCRCSMSSHTCTHMHSYMHMCLHAHTQIHAYRAPRAPCRCSMSSPSAMSPSPTLAPWAPTLLSSERYIYVYMYRLQHVYICMHTCICEHLVFHEAKSTTQSLLLGSFYMCVCTSMYISCFSRGHVQHPVAFTRFILHVCMRMYSHTYVS
jgi:hypothetical protein